MKKMLFLAILSCIGSMAIAQKVYFIYIQSEAGAPFYVKMGEKVYSSTASGYVILPKLKDSTYSLYLGQPGTQAKELRFSVAMNNADHGFLLKNFQNGWSLFDMQSMAVINPTPSTSGVMYDTNTVKNDFFTRLLAKAVDDSTLLMEPVLAKSDGGKLPKKEEVGKKASKERSEPVVKAPEAVSAKEDTAVKTAVSETVPVSIPENNVVKESANKQVAVSDSALQEEAVASARPSVSKDTTVSKEATVPQGTLASSAIAASKETVTPKETITPKETAVPKEVTVQTSPKPDKAPVENKTSEQPAYQRSVVKRYAESSNFQGFGLTFIDTWEGGTDTIRLIIPNNVDANALVNTEQPRENAPAADIVKKEPAATPDVSKDNVKTVPVVNESANKTSCKETASNKDFLDLRKNMSSKNRGEEMLEEAKKAFIDKCYTTEQIRKLSELFYTQEGKFLFFKEAKPYVSDKDRFNTLLFELNEDSYQDRFKSLLENKI